MARLRRHAEEVGERREAHPAGSLTEQAPCEPHRVHDGRRDPPTGEPLDLDVEKREVEPRVVRDDRRVAREGEQPPYRELRPRSAAERLGPDPRQRGDGSGKGDAGVDQGLERVGELERADPLRADLADPRRSRREPGRLEIDDDEVRVLEQEVRARRRGQPDRGATPRESRVARDDVVEERPREGRRGAREREEGARRLVGGHRPAPRLDELDEPVGGVEGQLHAVGW
ncbi:MAG: hypothetical protein M5U27_08240 [Gaiella sp.]|nr:hypothetical protein [Gaiella sp.]